MRANYVDKMQVFEWHKVFSEGREVIKNISHTSRSSTFDNDDHIEKVKETVLEIFRFVIREIAEIATHFS